MIEFVKPSFDKLLRRRGIPLNRRNRGGASTAKASLAGGEQYPEEHCFCEDFEAVASKTNGVSVDFSDKTKSTASARTPKQWHQRQTGVPVEFLKLGLSQRKTPCKTEVLQGVQSRGSGRSRTDDDGFAIRCLSHLATEPAMFLSAESGLRLSLVSEFPEECVGFSKPAHSFHREF